MRGGREASDTALPFYRPVAQLVERLSPKQKVVGSIPAWPACKPRRCENKCRVRFIRSIECRITS